MKKLLGYMGVDRAIVYTLAGRGWGLLSSAVTLLLVVRFLTPDEQGYYYTFASLLAMQIFFELGMSYVIMQFSSHEMVHLSWSDNGTIEGNAQSKNRLRSLLVLMAKWYGVIATFIIALILPIGWVFFSVSYPQSSVSWQVAWVWLVSSAAINIFFLPLLALLEGCGHITEIARLRMYQNIIGSLAAWGTLISGGGLLAMPAMNTGLAFTALVWLWRTKRVFFKNLLDCKIDATAGIQWKTEIWPFQWKIALSWLSGYFIFQLFTPVLFAYRGAVQAGQMGMSFSIANALMSIAMAWMSTKAPQFGTLIARKDYINLDQIFNLTLSRSLFVMVVLGAVLCLANYFLHVEHVQFASRFLDPLPFTLLMLATTLNYVTYAQSAYLRAHKQEPFLLISLVSAGLIAALTLVLGKEYGAVGVMSGYLSVCTVIGLGWGSKIFLSKRHEWQKQCVLKTSKNGML
jgi:O-antigen/teichoic acid export membrane protein